MPISSPAMMFTPVTFRSGRRGLSRSAPNGRSKVLVTTGIVRVGTTRLALAEGTLTTMTSMLSAVIARPRS